MTGSIEDSTFGLSSNRSNNALNQMQKSYNLNQNDNGQRNIRTSSMRSRKSSHSPIADPAVPDISD